MGFDEREYGFKTNEVGLDDINAVALVKDGKIVGEVSVDGARGLARKIAGKLW